VAIGFIVVSPVAWVVMAKWLHGFAFRTGLDVGVFLLVGLLVFSLAVTTITLQSLFAATSKPVKSLKYE